MIQAHALAALIALSASHAMAQAVWVGPNHPSNRQPQARWAGAPEPSDSRGHRLAAVFQPKVAGEQAASLASCSGGLALTAGRDGAAVIACAATGRPVIVANAAELRAGGFRTQSIGGILQLVDVRAVNSTSAHSGAGPAVVNEANARRLISELVARARQAVAADSGRRIAAGLSGS